MADNNKPNEPDLSALASDYMDLWQKQLSAMASDEAMATVMAQTTQLMNSGAAAVAAMATAASAQSNAERQHDETTDEAQGRNPGAATAGAASGVDDHVILQLSERLERLEKRIATLESGTVKPGR